MVLVIEAMRLRNAVFGTRKFVIVDIGFDELPRTRRKGPAAFRHAVRVTP
jgi:hypothetical protein